MQDDRLLAIVALAVTATLIGGAVAAGTMVQVGATDSSEEALQGPAQLRTVHAAPGVGEVDVLVDGQEVTSNLSYTEASPYQSIEAGSVNVTVLESASGDVLFEDSIQLAEDTRYSVLGALAVDDNGTTAFEPSVVTDDYEVPQMEDSTVRFVHTVPDLDAVDVSVVGPEGNETTVAENVSFGEAGAYVTLPEGDYTVQVRNAAGNETDNATDGVTTTTEAEAGEETTTAAENETEAEAGEETTTAAENETEAEAGEETTTAAENETEAEAGEETTTAAENETEAEAGEETTTAAENETEAEAGEETTTEAEAGEETTTETEPTEPGDAEAADGEVILEMNVTLEGGTVYSAVGLGFANASATDLGGATEGEAGNETENETETEAGEETTTEAEAGEETTTEAGEETTTAAENETEAEAGEETTTAAEDEAETEAANETETEAGEETTTAAAEETTTEAGNETETDGEDVTNGPMMDTSAQVVLIEDAQRPQVSMPGEDGEETTTASDENETETATAGDENETETVAVGGENETETATAGGGNQTETAANTSVSVQGAAPADAFAVAPADAERFAVTAPAVRAP
ncbi:DUF4397 domain-containing protein [Halorubellus sp. JP-L1]|uniref:DUF4397 domain-containing protein n=1 Tax=Halorubellus sp. JP-L1 TaxID=2715753 RepID=UPI00140BB12B|nr:DUF4397 domain-containing protein [Halorubellus sp. JP-L1]NHN43053.1 DUF4397 domain-containing protein [Halorubellus sp. JP-L1]